MVFPLIAVPVVALGGCGMIFFGAKVAHKRLYPYTIFMKELNYPENKKLKDNLENIIEIYEKKYSVRVNKRKLYSGLLRAFEESNNYSKVFPGEKTILYNLVDYIRFPSEDKKTNLFTKMEKYAGEGHFLEQTLNGIPRILLFIIILDIDCNISNKHFTIDFMKNKDNLHCYDMSGYHKLIKPKK